MDLIGTAATSCINQYYSITQRKEWSLSWHFNLSIQHQLRQQNYSWQGFEFSIWIIMSLFNMFDRDRMLSISFISDDLADQYTTQAKSFIGICLQIPSHFIVEMWLTKCLSESVRYILSLQSIFELSWRGKVYLGLFKVFDDFLVNDLPWKQLLLQKCCN